jgi:hypothetical protein
MAADLSLAMIQAIPSQLVLKLSWDNTRPGGSDFTLEKRKKSTEAISGKKRGWWIVFLSLPPMKSRNETEA